jgi:hypothetical protein
MIRSCTPHGAAGSGHVHHLYHQGSQTVSAAQEHNKASCQGCCSCMGALAGGHFALGCLFVLQPVLFRVVCHVKNKHSSYHRLWQRILLLRGAHKPTSNFEADWSCCPDLGDLSKVLSLDMPAQGSSLGVMFEYQCLWAVQRVCGALASCKLLGLGSDEEIMTYWGTLLHCTAHQCSGGLYVQHVDALHVEVTARAP